MTDLRLQPPAPLRAALRSEFLLAPDLTFLNHGSFGAALRVVLEEQTQWRERIEADPIELLGRRGAELLDHAKQAIGNWLGMSRQDFGLVTNATEAINSVLRSLDFSPGDELLTTSHVYNAVRQTMKYMAERTGASYREVDLPLPIGSPEVIEQAMLEAITPRTKLLVIDHVSSPTAVVFPLESILEACSKRGVDVLVDGAHAPGMLSVDVNSLAPAYYAGNLHKWTCGPKGSGFLWVRPDRQAAIHPVTISHHLGQGLAVPRAIEFFGEIGWERVMAHNHAMAVWVQQMLCQQWNVRPVTPLDGSLLGSMVTVPLPAPLDHLSEPEVQGLQQPLHDRDRIEVPIVRWSGRTYVRPCCHIYNLPADYQHLAEVITRYAEASSTQARTKKRR
jgi:isopenicillin-N epimerase